MGTTLQMVVAIVVGFIVGVISVPACKLVARHAIKSPRAKQTAACFKFIGQLLVCPVVGTAKYVVAACTELSTELQKIQAIDWGPESVTDQSIGLGQKTHKAAAQTAARTVFEQPDGLAVPTSAKVGEPEVRL